MNNAVDVYLKLFFWYMAWNLIDVPKNSLKAIILLLQEEQILGTDF